MIVIEGMDNSGKSTLAHRMAEYMELQVKESEGPPKGEDEINERVDRYLEMENTLFVRHPVISNEIYGQLREAGNLITPGRTMIFYDRAPTLIYCDLGFRDLEDHVVKDHDTPEHLDMISHQQTELLRLYRLWAGERAHFIYRIGDDMDQLISTVWFYLQYKAAP